jgi:hypothetical protein
MRHDLKCVECHRHFVARRINTKYCNTCNGSYRDPVVYMAVLENTDIVKIGFTGCLRKRIPQVSRENGRKAIVIAYRKGSYELEQRIHDLLLPTQDCMGRETYRLTADVVITFLNSR